MSPAPESTAAKSEPYALLVFDFMRAQEWFSESVRVTREALGLPPVSTAQALLLGHIAQGERRPARLARSIGVSRQAVSALVTQLVREGVLRTEPDPQDARALWVDFAPNHLAQRDAVVLILRKLERRLGEVIGEDRLAVLRHALCMDWGPPLKLDADALGFAPAAGQPRGRPPP